MGLVTPAAICFDHNLGLCFFTDTHKDYIYKADINANTIVPYISIKVGRFIGVFTLLSVGLYRNYLTTGTENLSLLVIIILLYRF